MHPFFAQADPIMTGAQAVASLAQAGPYTLLAAAVLWLGYSNRAKDLEIKALNERLITEIKTMAKDSSDVVKETREVFATIKDRLDRIGGPRP